MVRAVFPLFLAVLLLASGCIQDKPVLLKLPDNIGNYTGLPQGGQAIASAAAPNASNTSPFNSPPGSIPASPQSANSSEVQPGNSLAEPYAESAYNGTLPVIIYYYSSKCTASKELAPLIAEAEAYFNGTAVFIKYDVVSAKGFAAYDAFAKQRNITKRYVPLVRMGGMTLTGLAEINRSSLYNSLFAYINGSDGQ